MRQTTAQVTHEGLGELNKAQGDAAPDILRQQMGLVREVLDQHGHVDLLVNNAGRSIRRGVSRSYDRYHDFERTMQLNYFGSLKLILGFLPTMRERRDGQIVNISSISRAGNMGQANYSATKAGVAAMTVTWAKEFARHGVRVNTVSPGFIGTEMVRSMKPEALAKLSAMIPAGRIGEPDEIAGAVQFLVENDFMNGRNLEVDGGMRL